MLGIDDAVASIADIGSKLIDRLWPDPAQAAEAKLKLLEMQKSGELATLTAETDLLKGQLAVNQAEAANLNLFVSGWRPFVGWVCGFGLGYAIIFEPFITWAAKLAGSTVALPHVDTGMLMPVLTGMLGLAGMRTYEKTKGLNVGH